MLHSIQQSWIRDGIMMRMLYLVQDFNNNERVTHLEILNLGINLG